MANNFYDAYTKRKAENEQAGMSDLQQLGTLVQLQQSMQAKKQAAQEQELLKGGSVEDVMNAALRAGRPDVAAKLAPLVEAQRKGRPQPQPIGAGGLRLPDGTIVPPQARPEQPMAQSIGAGGLRLPDGTIVPPVMRPEKPTADRNYPIVQTADGIFERRPEGLVRLKDPSTGKPLNPTARERPLTEYQGKNAMYGVRASMAHKTLLDLEEKISVTGLAVKRGLQDIPVVGGALGAGANVALSKQQQQVEQAQRNFVNAVLRQESGAVINPSEFENAIKQYFPQPGDKKEVIEQKRQNRVAVINGFKKIADHAWDDEQGLAPQSGGWSITPVP